MKKFYIGTTLENMISILKEGFISTCPPHRVWKEYSKDYVYLVPYRVDEDHELHEEVTDLENYLPKILSVSYAFEQADFAVYELGHTKRVVMEITGIDESLLSIDEDAKAICAVKYPENIPISCISNIMVDMNDFSDEINTSIAVTKYFQEYQDRLHCLDGFEDIHSRYDEENGTYIELDQEEIEEIMEVIDNEIGIKHISKVFEQNNYGDSGDLDEVLENLREFLDLDAQFYEYSVEDFSRIYEVYKIAS